MILDKDINYVVSGLERSGTSMLMQLLKSGGIPVSFDLSRPPDKNNPKGYYELEGGKIINRLMDQSFPIDNYKGKFIKITAYGLKFIPEGNYKIIYSERNIDEIMDSMQKMANAKDWDLEETKNVFTKLNSMIKKQMKIRDDIDYILVNYNDIILNPKENIRKIIEFLQIQDKNLQNMIDVVDKQLYRQRRE